MAQSTSPADTGRIAARLAELGVSLPEAAKPIANYVPAFITCDMLIISGHVPMLVGKIVYSFNIGSVVLIEMA